MTVMPMLLAMADKRSRAQPERIRFLPGVSGQEETAVEAAPRPGRETRINKTDLEQHGYDADCPKCRHMQLHGKAKSGVFHTKRCRDNIVKAMSETPVGRARVEVHEERTTQALAERVEWNIRNQEPAALKLPGNSWRAYIIPVMSETSAGSDPNDISEPTSMQSTDGQRKWYDPELILLLSAKELNRRQHLKRRETLLSKLMTR